jgi:hypothetical protein
VSRRRAWSPSTLTRRFGGWFFAEGEATSAAALRIALGLYTLFVLWDLYPVLDDVLGHGGIFGTLHAEAVDRSGWKRLLWRHDSPADLAVFFWCWTAAAVCMTVGLGGRVAVLATFLLDVLFQERNNFVLYGTDAVYRHVMLWVCFLASTRVWSLDALIARALGRGRSPIVSLWPLRCIQIQIAIVYLFTGYFKVRADAWRDGSAVYYALHSQGLQTSVTELVIGYPRFLEALTYGTLAIELGFAPLVFTRWRYLALLAGLSMHVGIDLFMMIRFFSLLMVICYLAYVEPAHWRRMRGWVRSRRAAVRRATTSQQSCVVAATDWDARA